MTIILVTGATRGIGFAIIQLAASRIPPVTLVIGCRSVEAGRQAIERLRQLDSKATFDTLEIDIDLDDSILNAVNYIRKKYGKLDVLINNAAGVSRPNTESLEDIRENYNEVFNNVVTSNAIVTRAFSELLRKSDFPRVIMTSSARGSMHRTASRQLPPPRLIDYNVAKAGLNMLTLLLQVSDEAQVSEHERICYWIVSPGFTKTSFNNFRGTKDPLDSAEAFVRLLEADKGAIAGGHSGNSRKSSSGLCLGKDSSI